MSAQVNNQAELILDSGVIKVAAQRVFEGLNPIQHLTYSDAAKNFELYLNGINNPVIVLNVEAENIELFLFEYGLNLKQ